MSSRGMLELLRLAEIGRKRRTSDKLNVENTWSGIGFRVQKEFFVAPIGEVEEVLNLPAITPIPGVQEWLLGVSNIRGKIVTLSHLGLFLNLTKNKAKEHGSRLLLVNYPLLAIGLVVDEVFGLKHFSRNAYRRIKREDASSDDMPRLQACTDGSFFLNQQQWQVFLPSQLLKINSFYNVSRT